MAKFDKGLNAPTGAWCSLTRGCRGCRRGRDRSQCTYRCVVLPDITIGVMAALVLSQCTYRCVVLPDNTAVRETIQALESQCTYRCVVLPDRPLRSREAVRSGVSMHLQVRGAP